MALIHHEKKEINAKIVYYGPALSGKTANLKYIYEKMKPEYRGKLKFLNTASGKMLFFDFMRPDQIGVQDYNVRFHMYTLPGEIADFAVWKTVLKGVDGLVFVADSEPYKLPDNLQMYEKLDEYMQSLGLDTKDIPCLVQCNKQDIAGATTPDEMKDILHTTECSIIPASALNGEGVLNTLSTIVKMVLQKIRETPLEVDQWKSPEPDFSEPAAAGAGTPAVMSTESAEKALTPEEGIIPGSIHDTAFQSGTFSEAASDLADDDETGEEPGPYESAFLSEGMVFTHGKEEEITSVSCQEISTGRECYSAAVTEFSPDEETESLTGMNESEATDTEIDFAGEPEYVAPGHLRIPVTVRHGHEAKTISINLKLSVEAADN